jgi:hypothetical protein
MVIQMRGRWDSLGIIGRAGTSDWQQALTGPVPKKCGLVNSDDDKDSSEVSLGEVGMRFLYRAEARPQLVWREDPFQRYQVSRGYGGAQLQLRQVMGG